MMEHIAPAAPDEGGFSHLSAGISCLRESVHNGKLSKDLCFFLGASETFGCIIKYLIHSFHV